MPIQPSRNSFTWYLLLGFVATLLSLTGCKKGIVNKAGDIAEQPTQSTSITLTQLTIASLNQYGFVIRYQLSSPAVSTGVMFSTDSILLVNDASTNNGFNQKADSLIGNTYSTAIKSSEEFTSRIYWFKIYYTGNNGKTYYSKIYKQALLEIPVDNTPSGWSLEFASKYPERYFFGGYFTYKNEFYVIQYSDPQTTSFLKWNPITNIWQKLPNLSTDWDASIVAFVSGHEINNVIYFPPTKFNDLTFNGITTPYTEVMYTYTPSTGVWEHKKVFKSNNYNNAMRVLDAFVYQSKFYCIIRYSLKDVIKVYDPGNDTWKEVMDLPNGTSSCRVVVLDDKIYLFAAFDGTQSAATTDFVNKFYVLDLNNKALLEKNHIISNEAGGTDRPYLFTYNKKIYVYGGLSSSGYSTIFSPLFAVYDPIYDKWSPVAKNYSSATVGQTDGYIYQINGKIYIGGGYNNENNSGPASYNNSIYLMLLQ